MSVCVCIARAGLFTSVMWMRHLSLITNNWGLSRINSQIVDKAQHDAHPFYHYNQLPTNVNFFQSINYRFIESKPLQILDGTESTHRSYLLSGLNLSINMEITWYFNRLLNLQNERYVMASFTFMKM